jgi:hypothetical protein
LLEDDDSVDSGREDGVTLLLGALLDDSGGGFSCCRGGATSLLGALLDDCGDIDSACGDSPVLLLGAALLEQAVNTNRINTMMNVNTFVPFMLSNL